MAAVSVLVPQEGGLEKHNDQTLSTSNRLFDLDTLNFSNPTCKRSYAQFINLGSAWSHDRSTFKPDKHLAYEPPIKVHMMTDLSLPADKGVSPVAVSEPFHLFSKEAIDIMRSEVLDEKVYNEYSFTSDIAPRQIRGYTPK